MAPAGPVITADEAAIARAAQVLRRGGLVAFPTETVYGLGGDAQSAQAVARIYAAKGRPGFNPLIVHVADAALAAQIAQWPSAADRLAALWPGALTLVLPLRDGHGLPDSVTAGLDSVGLRVPAHPVARALLRAFGGPVAAPSANPSGQLSPTAAGHVKPGLADLVLDGGACPVGVESTIVSLLGAPRILRPGGVSRETLEATLGAPVLDGPEEDQGTAPRRSPGQLSSHYAPRAAVRLNAETAAPDEVHIGFGAIAGDVSLSPTGNLEEAAARLFDVLHAVDAQARPIAVAPIPEEGLGAAINDRLRRAAAPRG
ncbi:MAG: L-threonylcarbamoyladenylate synthase [Pseudomonadota bacterium]